MRETQLCTGLYPRPLHHLRRRCRRHRNNLPLLSSLSPPLSLPLRVYIHRGFKMASYLWICNNYGIGLVWRIYYGLAIILWIGHYRRSRVMDWSIETLVGVIGCF